MINLPEIKGISPADSLGDFNENPSEQVVLEENAGGSDELVDSSKRKLLKAGAVTTIALGSAAIGASNAVRAGKKVIEWG